MAVEQDLTDSSNPLMIYAKLFAFTDYSDNLYVTVSMNASGFLAGQTGNSNGQFLPNPPINATPHALCLWARPSPTASGQRPDELEYSCFTVSAPPPLDTQR
jgi:hypothetical protein